MKVIALYNIKGGVGKTAASANLSYLAAAEGNRTLLCDLDPQGSASYYFRVRAPKKFNTGKLLKGGRSIEKNIRGTDFDNLDLLPADISFRKLDIRLDEQKKSRKVLKNILTPLNDHYDLVFLDCPPNITLLSENIFNAATHIVVPLIPTTLSVMTYDKLIKFFKSNDLDSDSLLPFFSMVERRKKLHREIMDNARESSKFGRLLSASIPYNSTIEKMGVYRQPVHAFNPNTTAARAYEKLWSEIRQKSF